MASALVTIVALLGVGVVSSTAAEAASGASSAVDVAPEADVSAAAAGVSPQAVDPCSQVVFVGAAGSGETDNAQKAALTEFMGSHVKSVRDRLRDTWKVPMVTHAVNYPAESTTTLAPSAAEAAGLAVPGSASTALTIWYANRVKPFTASIEAGAAHTVWYVTEVSKGCQNKRPIVLAGYSQGAMVMHRAMTKLATTAQGRAALSKVVGVVLLADGDRVAGSGATWLAGGAPTTGKGITTLLPWNPRVDITVTMRTKTFNVCAKNDIVCDSGLSQIVGYANSSRIHTSYAYATVEGSPLWKATNEVGKRLTGRSTPPPPPGAWKQFSAGYGHTCAVTVGGAAYCWGHNWKGQLGNGTTTKTKVPVGVRGLGAGVASISAGRLHSCAVMKSGAAFCWGVNQRGELGNGTTSGATTPVRVTGLGSRVASISAADRGTCATTLAGGAYCWGSNGNGTLGNGTSNHSTVPVPVVGLGSGVASVSAGTAHNCATTTAGAAWCWGYGYYGQLGNGTRTNASVPVPVRRPV